MTVVVKLAPWRNVIKLRFRYFKSHSVAVFW